MGLQETGNEVPRWIPGSIIAFILVSLIYGIFVIHRPLQIVSVWLGLLGFGLVLVVIYLLYRIVLAVERNADSG